MGFEARKASRKKAKLRLGFSGPSGSGKTYSALLLASGLCEDWDKIFVIDTEQGSSELYSHLGQFNAIPFGAPYTPQRYVEAIDFALSKGAEVIVIDSVSHEWQGEGGCLQIHEKFGGRFQDWAKVTPMHQKFLDRILTADAHVFTTTRKKQDYALETNSKGRVAPKKLGLKEIQRDGFEYELTVNFDIDISHLAKASKDRTGLFDDPIPFLIDAQTGAKIRDWNNEGVSVLTTPMTNVDSLVIPKELEGVKVGFGVHAGKLVSVVHPKDAMDWVSKMRKSIPKEELKESQFYKDMRNLHKFASANGVM